MITRRHFASGTIIAGTALWTPGTMLAQGTPAAEDTASEVVTITTPVELEERIIVDHYRLVTSQADGDAVILGSITNARDEVVAIPAFNFDVLVRDPDRVILGSATADPVYPVIAPGKSIGFVTWFTDISAAEIDPETVSFDVGEFSADDAIIEQLAEATVEIERQDVISKTDDLQIEFVVRNTSDLDYSSLNPEIAVWDADWLFCGKAYASVLTLVPAGDAIRFTTHSSASAFNPLLIAGDDFTIEPWITPTVSS
jgi:hypothetical protein